MLHPNQDNILPTAVPGIRRVRSWLSRPRRGLQKLTSSDLLRQSLDGVPGGKERTLILASDGGYTNSTVLKNIPPRTI